MEALPTTDDTSLLLTLEEISQLIAHSHDPGETLSNVVRLVQDRFKTAVCSVYLLDPYSRELVLSATVGLEPTSIGRVRMGLDEGLTGLVGEQMSPVMVADAHSHPRFKFFPEAGEEKYRSFLGVPLIESGELEGVLVVQTAEPRTFTSNEERMLVTVAGQVASLVGDAQLLDQIRVASRSEESGTFRALLAPQSWTGVKLSPGVGLGSSYVIGDLERWRRTLPLRRDREFDAEKDRLTKALHGAQEELVHLSQHISQLVGEDHGAILQAQLMLMRDRNIESDLDQCMKDGASAEGALLMALDRYVSAFDEVSTSHLQERVYDLKDVFHRILWRLQPAPRVDASEGKVILVLHEASVMQLFSVDLDRLAGVVVEHGGPQSHAAILARSLGVPMVGQIRNMTSVLGPGCRVLIDGDEGTVLANPDDRTLREVMMRARDGESLEGEGEVLPEGLPRVEANINLLSEVEAAVEQGANAVGLFRSELLFLARRTLPSEDEQVSIYRKLVRQLDGRPVCIRTFDLRPDKVASYSHLGAATARTLDWRAVLESPPLQQLFHDQIRAILRVAAEAPIRILIPLVTRTELLNFVRDTVSLARCELAEEERAYDPNVPLGVMIEVAAAVPLIRFWGPFVDFFALGTNDLTASALDADRDNPVSTSGSDPFHPGLIHLVDQAVRDAHSIEKPMSVCGELAADPVGALILAALDVDSLSVPVQQLRRIRKALRNVDPASLPNLREELLNQPSATQIRELIQRWK